MLRDDYARNRGNSKSLMLVLSFRVASLASRLRRAKPRTTWLVLPVLIAYKVCIEWIGGCELPPETLVGRGLRIYHGQGLVVHRSTIVGRNVTLRQNTTIGVSGYGEGRRAPTLADGVDVGAHSVILGGIRIGQGARVGAGSVVTSDVADGETVVGNPAGPLPACAARPAEVDVQATETPNDSTGT